MKALEILIKKKNQCNSPLFPGWAIILFCVLSGCNKSEIGPQCTNCLTTVVPGEKDVLIGCEGNYGWGNASLSVYNPIEKTTQNNIFDIANNFPLGDVLQSMQMIDGKLFLVVDNSSKIEVIDTSSYQKTNTINGFNSPRYCVAHNTTLFVTELWGRAVKFVNLLDNSAIATLTTHQTMGHVVLAENKIWAACTDTNAVLVIDPVTLQIIDTVRTQGNPNTLVTTNNEVWALTKSHLLKLGSSGVHLSVPLLFPQKGSGNLCVDTDQKMYFFNNGLCTYQPDNNTIELKLPATNAIWYGLGVSPRNKDIYIADALDYVQPGNIYRFDSLFMPVDTFQVGVIPQSFYFK